MTEGEIEQELQAIKEQLARLQEEHAKTRNGWLYWLRNTGLLLMLFGAAVFAGVLKSHAKIDSSPVGISLTVIALFMFVLGLWLLAWSCWPKAERIMRVAGTRSRWRHFSQ
jgi:hypothetical protein